mgnify:CR=1 FL=1
MRRMGWALLGVTAAGCHATTTAPAAARTPEEARARMDRALADLAWAHRDCWALGCRDVVGTVQLDTAYAPQYVRLARGAR